MCVHTKNLYRFDLFIYFCTGWIYYKNGPRYELQLVNNQSSVCVALLSEAALKQTPQTIIKQEEDDLQQMIHPPAFVIQMRSTWRSHIPKARGNQRSDTSTQTLGTPKRPKESGREGGAIVFEWVYMCVLLRISRFFSVTCVVPLPLSVIPPITCLSLPLSLPLSHSESQECVSLPLERVAG